jgi:hypothetical protein
MPFPIAIPLAISAIKALIKFRGQVDVILSLKEASAALPFALPEAPPDNVTHRKEMLAFFQTPQGQSILEIKGEHESFANVLANPTDEALQGPRSRLFKLYCQATDTPVLTQGPQTAAASPIISGPSTEMRLAYYVVESHRLSRNTAVTRILMATADMLLEVAGENAGLFLSHPRRRALVQTFLEEFAGKSDFNDEGFDRIFKSLLGATIVAALDNPGDLQDKPAINMLFGALREVRAELGDNFVAEIIAVDGFESLLSTYLTHVAKDPSFITKDELAQQVIAATLAEVGQNLPQLTSDPKAFIGILQVGLTAAAANVAGILDQQLGGKPLLAVLLSALAKELAERAQADQLFKSIADGALIPALYRAALQAIAANPALIAQEKAAQDFLAALVSGLSTALAQPELSAQLSPPTLQELACKSLDVLSAQPRLLGHAPQFAMKVLAAIFAAGAPAIAAGFTTHDLLTVAQAALKTASEQRTSVDTGDAMVAVLTSVGRSLAEEGLRPRLTPAGWKAMLTLAVQVAAANPMIWKGFHEKNLGQPVIRALMKGLASDPSGLLAGPVFVDASRRVLIAAARRGRQIIDAQVSADDLGTLITLALKRAEQEIGRTIDGENLPRFLERLVVAYLQAPFPIPQSDAQRFSELVNSILPALETA